MQISTKTAFISCSIIAATACSSGGGGEEETFGDIEDRYLPVLERLDNSPELPSSEIPTTGEANYAGVAWISAQSADYGAGLIAGDIGLTIGFANTGSVNGKIDEFVFVDLVEGTDEFPQESATVISMDGELDISNGSVIRASRRGRPTFFNADIDGNVTLPPEITGESTDQVASITGDLSFGRFYEDGVAGDIDLVASVQGVGSEELNGQFAAENQ